MLGLSFAAVPLYRLLCSANGFDGKPQVAKTALSARGERDLTVRSVRLARAFAGHFTPKQHGGFEFAAWYWHFVDVVWLFLFSCIYVWGSFGAAIDRRGGRAAKIAGETASEETLIRLVEIRVST